MLVGSLKCGQMIMLTLDDKQVVKAEIVKDDLSRVRNVK